MNTRINKPLENTDNNRKQFGIHGAGNIGLGLLADIISQNGKYHIKGTSSDEFLKNVVNSTHRFSLQHGHNESSKKTVVNNVEIISRKSGDIVNLYTESNLVAICLTPEALVNSAEKIAHGIINRHKEKNDCLKIFILMNKPECDKFVKETITTAMQTMGHFTPEIEKILSTVQFIETVADRIVSKIDVTKVKKQLRDQLSHVLKEPKEIEHILNNHAELKKAIKKFNLECNLFNAEEKFALHVPNNISEVDQFPMMTKVNSLLQVREIKNKFINGPHAIIAWLGALMGCNTIADAIKHPDIFTYIQTLMLEEIGPALKAEFTDLSDEDLQKQMREFFRRCTKSQEDKVTRVGRDLLRKLNEHERIRGTIELCEMHHLSRPDGLLKAIAVGLSYAINGKDEPTDPQCEKIREVYKKQRKVYQQQDHAHAQHHAYKDVICYKDGSYSGLDPKNDKKLIKNIAREIAALQIKIDDHDHKMKIDMYGNDATTSTVTPRHHTIKTNDELHLTRKWSTLPFFSQNKTPKNITNTISSHRALNIKNRVVI